MKPRAPLLVLALLTACGGGGGEPGSNPPPFTPSPVTLRTEVITSALDTPWGLAFLPDGRYLVTERPGRMRIVAADGTISAPLAGLPAVRAAGQGGLLDVALDPDFAGDPYVYWSYAEPGTGSEAGLSGTAVARGRLVGTALQNVQVIFRQQPKVGGDGHYGARLAFAPDKTLYVTLGERQLDDPASPGSAWSQNPAVQQGKVMRMARDGSGAVQFSLGHRNPQGAAVHPGTGELWLVEHGPQGGDELNRVLAGRNYGWPLRSYGCPYGSPIGDACRVGGGTHAPQFEEPLTYWVPTSIAPSGLAFYTGTLIPQWTGSVFAGALAGQALWRLTLQGNAVSAREALYTELHERIRDVRQGPDGRLYLLTDSAAGRLIRIGP
jgi:glucose/arabinose dehydrogenase